MYPLQLFTMINTYFSNYGYNSKYWGQSYSNATCRITVGALIFTVTYNKNDIVTELDGYNFVAPALFKISESSVKEYIMKHLLDYNP